MQLISLRTEIIIKIFYSGNKHVNHYINSVFCWHFFKIFKYFFELSPPSPWKFGHFSNRLLYIFIWSDLPKVMGNVGEQVNKTVNEFLSSHGFSARDEAQQRLLVGQITEMSSKDNRVYKLLCKLSSFPGRSPLPFIFTCYFVSELCWEGIHCH